MSLNDTERPERPPTAAPRRRPRIVLGTFWLLLGILAIAAGIAAGNAWTVIVGIALVGYSVYLYRGGRFGIWFLPF